jgi:hypothetical protein
MRNASTRPSPGCATRSRAGMEAQVLYCQQAEALMVNALPIGMGMK